jgi:sugar/nucleoside kinase (ribokinase family)
VTKRVVIVGDVMLDVVVKPIATIVTGSDTPARVRISRGGSGANIAVALAAMGHQVIYVGACADDTSRMIVERALRADKVESRLEVVGGSTGVVVALVGEDAQRSMLTDRGANIRLSEGHVTSVLDEPFDHVHVSGYTLLDAETRGVGVAALRVAREAGRTSSVDVCSAGPLREVGPGVFLVAAREAGQLFANAEEAMVLSGCDDVESARESLSRSFAEVVITRGSDGADAMTSTSRAHADSRSADVLDTTGAGDAATGAYLGARFSGATLDQALALAMAASAIVVRTLGAQGYSRL